MEGFERASHEMVNQKSSSRLRPYKGNTDLELWLSSPDMVQWAGKTVSRGLSDKVIASD